MNGRRVGAGWVAVTLLGVFSVGSGALAAGGCATRPVVNAAGELERGLDSEHRVLGRFGAVGLSLSGRPVTVRTGDSGLAPSAAWTLVNAADELEGDALVSKEGDAWVREALFDVDGSGVSDRRALMPRYDLLFRHRYTGASLALRTLPLATWAGELSLETMAQARIEADSSEMAVAIAHGSSAAVALEQNDRIAILVGGAAASVAELDAYAFEYTIHEVDRIELGVPEVPHRVRTVLVRTDWSWELADHGWPVVMEFTVSARADRFDESASGLQDLISRTIIAPMGTTPGLGSAADAIVRCVRAERPVEYTLEVRYDRRHGPSKSPTSLRVDGGAIVPIERSSPLRVCLQSAVRRGLLPRNTITVNVGRRPPLGDVQRLSDSTWREIAAQRPTAGGDHSRLSPAPTKRRR